MSVLASELLCHRQRFHDEAVFPVEAACQPVDNSCHAAEEVQNEIQLHIQDLQKHLGEKLGVVDPMIGEEACVPFEDLAIASK
jgi:hypothetical protein